MGCNIGTTITAQIAALNGTRTSRSTAMGHTFFNTFGTLLFIPLLLSGFYEKIVLSIVPGALSQSNVMFHIAVAHSLFNITNVLIFSLLLWPLLIKLANLLGYGRDLTIDVSTETKYLDPLLLADPPIAMQQTIFELAHMAGIAKTAVKDAEDSIMEQDKHKSERAMKKEDILDDFQKEITSYLVRISQKNLDTIESKEYPLILHSVNDIEKIGDYAKNLAGYAMVKMDKKIQFSETASKGLKDMFAKLYELFDSVIKSLQEKDTREAYKAIKIEDQIDNMKLERRTNYIKSINQKKSDPESEMMAMDIASNIEKMGDHLISISKAVLKDLQWGRKISISEEG